ncbi:Homeodomain-like protein, partial [Ramicandelaber brevisporus]
KRHRSTKEQQQVLNEAFAREQHPTSQVREKLAEQLGMDPRSVQIWFQNRRASAK